MTLSAPTTARIRAVDAEHVSLTIRVPKEFMADLEQVAAALSHIVPNRKPAEVIWECIRRTLAERERRKGGLPARPPSPSTSTTPAPGVTSGAATVSGAMENVPSKPGSTPTPAPGVTLNTSRRAPRHVPIDDARVVWDRDDGRCAYVGTDGRRCNSTHQLELHHRKAHALGGETSAENLTLYCRAHNGRAAEDDFGAEFMAGYRT